VGDEQARGPLGKLTRHSPALCFLAHPTRFERVTFALQTSTLSQISPADFRPSDESALRNDPYFADGDRVVIFPLLDEMGPNGITGPKADFATWYEASSHYLENDHTKTAARPHRSPWSKRKVLSLFLLPKNVVPVVLVGFGYWLLTLAHTLLFWCSVRLAFSLGRGIWLGLDNFILGDRFFRRTVFDLID
jgi:hypothetical protein